LNDHAPLPRSAPEPTVRPATLTAPVPISEAAFHRAIGGAADYTSSFAGDTFLVPAYSGIHAFVRVNDRHFRFEADAIITHNQILRHVGDAPARKEDGMHRRSS
jgi:hypothetical protein